MAGIGMTYYEQLNQKARRTAKRNGVLFSKVEKPVHIVKISDKFASMFQYLKENKGESLCTLQLHIPTL